MIEMIEIIFASIAISGSIVWLTKAFEKFNRLKTEHKHHAKWFASIVNDKNASDDLKKCIIADEKTRMLAIEGIMEKYK